MHPSILRRPSPRALVLVAAVAAAAVAAMFAGTGSAAPSHRGGTSAPKPTVVLVHGAWADGSGWSAVIRRLQRDGYAVFAPANPLRSLSGDSAYLASILAQTPGPIILVGHSYGGAVITNAAAGNTEVKALVYVDAFIPDVAEQVNALAGPDSQIPTSIEFKAFPPFGPTDIDVYLKADAFRATFAADVSATRAAIMAAAQRPLGALAGGEPTTATAWRTIPSWALVGLEDRAIPADQQLFMATRAKSTIVKVHSSHVAMISQPRAVVGLIESAARATT